MNVKNYFKVLDKETIISSYIKLRSWDRMNGFRYWNYDDFDIQKAKVMNVEITKGDVIENGVDIEMDIDITKLRDEGIL